MKHKSIDCYTAWKKMTEISQNRDIRNFVQMLDMKNFTVETDLFPKQALEAYSAWNLGKELDASQYKLINESRGGEQGNYRKNMPAKIINVIDCLTNFPNSKRATLTIPNNSNPDHKSDKDAKCMRELHFYLKNNKLNATVLFRAQAASIFPKNIHFIGSMMMEIASQIPNRPDLGQVYYVATIVVADRT